MKRILLAGMALAKRAASSAPVAPSRAPKAEMPDIVQRLLMNVVMPLWLGAGVADWVCHRRASIETTSGPKESLMHLAMLMEAAIPMVAGMFLEITAPVLLVMIAAMLLHDATGLWDVTYASKTREVTPIEQHVHSYLEGAPVMAVAFICVLHWPQLLGLLGLGEERPDWRIRRKQPPLPWRYVSVMLTMQVALEWLPYMEELIRTLRARPEQGRSGGAAP